MCNLLKLLLILIFMSSVDLYSMGDNDVRFSRLTSYSFSSPQAISKDKFGFLWIGASDGLVKYDGYSYKSYTNDPNDASSISNGNIRSILLDATGNLWIATTNGLNRYNYLTDKFIIFNFETKKQNFIYEIFESSDGSIWIATEDGIKRKKNNSNNFENFSYYNDRVGSNNKIGEARTFFQDIDDILWVGTINSGILRFDFSNDFFMQLPSK
ncbi:MAG: hypothetical protein HQ521_12555, partial [Bacteroidetes bacterium]|nr:hypothetical protein [Bacteroidota bacterium]